MADTLSKTQRSALMSKVRGRETKPEKELRSLIFRRGYRFRKNVKALPGTPDIVLPKYRSVIFVNGCFWHQHRGCRLARRPATHTSYWDAKLDRNVERDKKTIFELKKLGWKILVVWQCQFKDEDKIVGRLRHLIGS